ncbi:metal ABC transporter ATP-binding protein, partial [Candidatus Gottesmanbacteria bacterium]|nr:metal ABC transporter ATP-binding protein [Candidatus Gottesmanbacteria bacterium]
MQYIDHTKNIIQIKNISYSYGKQPVLRNISFNVHEGDYLGIIGPNGGGKTTLIKIILGLLKPSSGRVEMYEEDIGYFKNWQKIGYIPQKAINFDANFPVTVSEVVSMGLFAKKGLLRFLDASDHKKVIQALRLVEMEEYGSHLIGDLSGGQQQRVFIAKAMVTEPSLLILD